MHVFSRLRLLVVAAAAAAVLGAACDQGTEPGGHDHVIPPGGGTCGHIDSASGLTLVYIHTGDSLAVQHRYGLTGEIHVSIGEALLHGIEVTFLDAQQQPIRIANDCAINRLGWWIADDSVAHITQDPGLRWFFNVEPRRMGRTTVVLRLEHDAHQHFESLPIPIVVGP